MGKLNSAAIDDDNDEEEEMLPDAGPVGAAREGEASCVCILHLLMRQVF